MRKSIILIIFGSSAELVGRESGVSMESDGLLTS